MNQVIEFIFKFTSFFSICIIGIFLTFTEEICFFIYHNLDTVNFLILLSPLIILIYLDKIIDAMLRGLDKQVGVMICNIVDLVSTTFLIYTLVPVWFKGLDPETERLTAAYLLRKTAGKTVFLVSHNPRGIERMQGHLFRMPDPPILSEK